MRFEQFLVFWKNDLLLSLKIVGRLWSIANFII